VHNNNNLTYRHDDILIDDLAWQGIAHVPFFPLGDGTVLLVASDMHLGALLGHGWASERTAQFESLRPNLLLLVGDIFEGDETTYPN
jgi:hypothetical protein